MDSIHLILYSRKGCCLCEGLQDKLLSLDLESLVPTIHLRVIDIDSNDVSKIDKDRYSMLVPILAFKVPESNELVCLPRLSPRINNKDLLKSLEKSISKLSKDE